MKHKGIHAFTPVMLTGALLPATALANASWHWLTKTNPVDVLPYAVAATLLIEYVAIKRINSIAGFFRLFVMICIANMASFLLPYAVLLIPSEVGYTFEMSIRHLPKYIVGVGYAFLTLIVEVPVIYMGLTKYVASKKRLLISIVLVNIVTTAMVAVIERIICRGSW